jgi:hypothetical protein
MSEFCGMFATYFPTNFSSYSDLILIATKPEAKEQLRMDAFLVIISFNDGMILTTCTYFQRPITLYFKDV